MSGAYPRLEVKLSYITENAQAIVKRCQEMGVSVTGIFKGTNGIPEITEALVKGGLVSVGTSRLEQVEEMLDHGVKAKEVMMIRTPMLSEAADVVRLTDVSTNSEREVIAALNEESKKQGKKHKVILMADVGDLREGYWDVEELVETAEWIEKDLENIYLAGVGTNIGCYGSIEPTVETLQMLADKAERIEDRICRRLDIVSGGASSSLTRIWDKDMPPKINHLRVGGETLLAFTNRVVRGYQMRDLHHDAFYLQAEISELKMKPAAGDPEGRLRKKALLNVGKADYCNADALYPVVRGVKIEKAFDDHTLIDIENCIAEYKVGSIVGFDISYGALVYLTNSRNVKIDFV